LALGGAGRARRVARADSRGRGGALAAGVGQLMAAARDWGVLDLDVDAERRLETLGEQLNPLPLGKQTNTREERLEPILILGDRVSALAFSQFGQRGRAQQWPIMQVQQLLEATPRQGALVRLDLDVPHLCALLQVVGGHPDLLLLHDPLLMEIRLTAIGEDQRIIFSVIAGKVHLLEPWWSIVVVLPIVAPGAAR
jgi:hypothetical protein